MGIIQEAIRSLAPKPRAALEGLPAVKDAIHREESAQKDMALQARLRCLDDLAANAEQIKRLNEEIARQQVATNAAHDAYVEQAGKLGEMTTHRTRLQDRESSLCGELGGTHGEHVLDRQLSLLHGVIFSVPVEVDRKRYLMPSGPYASDPQSSVYQARKRLQAEIDGLIAYHDAVKAAYSRLVALRLARIGPSELAAKVEEIVTPLQGFRVG